MQKAHGELMITESDNMKFYIADMHLCHENVIRYDSRPFKNIDQMNNELVKRWNDTVAENDEVYILGDFCWKKGRCTEFVSQLKGRKFLIRGNHDDIPEDAEPYFEWIKDYAVITDSGAQVVLSHYPVAHWINQFRGSVHLYGHVHNNKDYYAYVRYGKMCLSENIPFESYNVGVMMYYMDYTPRTLDEIIFSSH
ncbi:MAG: metallophosphoesterase [Oscillospiraceae bacterium]|nr:metallophosphoesterase [Oscillospiraceae bacterium]